MNIRSVSVLDRFHPAVATWFAQRFGAPTEAQAQGWASILEQRDTLVMAPTGSGKTLAAFLAGLDKLVRRAAAGALDDRVRIIYVSPLKALGADVERNLLGPLRGIEHTAAELGRMIPPIRTALRTGDTTQAERAKILRRPPHILITTPESLYLLLTSTGGRAILGDVETVIVDEVHALVGNKRGAHMAISLERLSALVHCGGDVPVPPRSAEPREPPPTARYTRASEQRSLHLPGMRRSVQRIGLSATVEPPIEAARFLVGCDERGEARPCTLIDAGRRQPLDLAIEIPDEPLAAVASRRAWQDVYAKIVALVVEQRSTLIFVPSRRLAERVAHDLEPLLAARLGEGLGKNAVAAHHGALSKRTRLLVERRLQSGELRAVVATASLELGIDVGHVDLVCQIGSPRAISVLRQRIGRARHNVGGTPRGCIFALTRDELVECMAGVYAMKEGRLDRPIMREAPLDILSQQLVAIASASAFSEDELFRLIRGASPYAKLTRARFDQVVSMLGDGIATRRGRSGAHLHLDRIGHQVRGRRGARLAALTSGGAIPDKADYVVIEEPTDAVVGTLDEDFAIESMAGDVFLLGSTSWRVRRVIDGQVRVEDAHGAAPSVPFWNGEGLARTAELSDEVCVLREALAAFVARIGRGEPDAAREALAWLAEHCAVGADGASQALDYIAEGTSALGALPTRQALVAERFFDESGGMQLVIHAPLGARVNRAWGLALRKSFCRSFDFELQAAATDDAVLLSLGPQHSFPLETIFDFVRSARAREVLEQAILQSPMWETRWRWSSTRSLAVLRHQGGRRTPPQLLRMKANDLLAAVFPAQAGCQDNHGGGDVELPDHPLVHETMDDCLFEAMDLHGLERLLAALESGEITVSARDTTAPSVFAHAILNANPYSFLDDAPLEERRSRAVQQGPRVARGAAELVQADHLTIDPAAIDAVLAEVAPDPRDPDELHDLLLGQYLVAPDESWLAWFELLRAGRRATSYTLRLTDGELHAGWVATERIPILRAIHPAAELADDRSLELASLAALPSEPLDPEATLALVLGARLRIVGPRTAAELAQELGLPIDQITVALAGLEADGQVLQGRFRTSRVKSERSDASALTTSRETSSDAREQRAVGGGSLGFAQRGGTAAFLAPEGRGVPAGAGGTSPLNEFCERGLLQRIHRRTLNRRRASVSAVSQSDLYRFLLRWQHLAQGHRLRGLDGLRAVIGQLEGMELPAAAWERDVLPARVADYDPAWLDQLCLSGEVAWGRLRVAPPDPDAPQRGLGAYGPSGAIALFQRAHGEWLVAPSLAEPQSAPSTWPGLSELARKLAAHFERRGAAFLVELEPLAKDVAPDPDERARKLDDALWELVRHGVLASDGFDGLRALLVRRRARGSTSRDAVRSVRSIGRWSLIHRDAQPRGLETGALRDGSPVEHAWLYLRRYGVVVRDLLARESLAPSWRELVDVFRRLEARGEIRGGRFVTGLRGEQFALPEALEQLSALPRTSARVPGRTLPVAHEKLELCATDPLNLVGILSPGPRWSPLSTARIQIEDGIPLPPLVSTPALQDIAAL